jgi:hypothetical protein
MYTEVALEVLEGRFRLRLRAHHYDLLCQALGRSLEEVSLGLRRMHDSTAPSAMSIRVVIKLGVGTAAVLLTKG